MSAQQILPSGYGDWLKILKSRIASARQRAALAVNQELVTLYHSIGKDILQRQASEGWGAKVIRINQQWRIVFRWENGNATAVQITDYH